MNWEYVIGEVYNRFQYFVIVIASYYFSKVLIVANEENKDDKILLDYFPYYLSSLVGTLVLSSLFSNGSVAKSDEFYVNWIFMGIPSLTGITVAIIADRKGREKKRQEQKKFMEEYHDWVESEKREKSLTDKINHLTPEQQSEIRKELTILSKQQELAQKHSKS